MAWGQARVSVRPRARIVDSVDDTARVTLRHSHPDVVDKAIISGHLDPSTEVEAQLVLAASDEQETALRGLLDEQQDKTSPNYHKWLNPKEFGDAFGVAPEDVSKVTGWLQSRGLSVKKVARSGRYVEFSGTSQQLETAFQTRMDKVVVDGEEHISNTTDIAIPAALATVVRGVARLNDFAPKPMVHGAHTVQIPIAVPPRNYVTAEAQPLFGTSSTGTHYVDPGDAATIFNTNPLLGAGIDGTGVSIAVLARSNISLGDVEAFRTVFGLKTNDPTITVVGSDPGQNGDDVEAFLDAEWAGAMAPGASVNFVVGGPSLVSGGIDSAAIYAVDNNIADIITLSYGGCERLNGLSNTSFYNQIWEQAAAQGQTVFVSTGDSGAAGCDSSGASFATGGYGVNALGSSAFNVAVGGSMFVDFGPAQYWGAVSAPPYASALSYIPEAGWNQGRLTTTYLNSSSTGTVTGSGIAGTGGGIAAYTARPSWQTGNGITAADPVPATGTGRSTVPSDPGYATHRLVPDVSLISASGHDGALFCAEGVCGVTSSGTLLTAGVVGGTSVATPVMASMQALINQKNGGRQGNANYHYYKLANNDYVAGNCQAVNGTAGSPTVTLPAATCNFHDVVAGSNLVPTSSFGSASIGFSSGVGFDEVTGLGSLNANNLATNWSTVAFTATTTTFTLNPLSSTHGTAMSLAVTVAPTSGPGTPTGDISLIAETTNPYTVNKFTLSGGTFNGTVNYLPGGSYKVHVHYAGDGTFGASDSASVTVNIAKENSTLTATSYNVTTSGSVTATSTFSYGAMVYIDVPVTGVSGSGNGSSSNAFLPVGTVPSGSVTFNVVRNGTALAPLTTSLDTYGDTYMEAALSISSFYLKANYPALSPGSYTVTANYGGDASFNGTSGSVSFTVSTVAPTVSFTGPTNITSGESATFTYKISPPSSLSSAATGTVSFSDSVVGSLGTATLTNGIATFTTTGITGTGAHTVTASYAGDTNYAPAVNTLAVTVGSGSALTVGVSASGTLQVNSSVTLTATLSSTASGTVRFFDNGTLLGSVSSGGGTTTYNLASAGFTAGSHTIMASYGGSTTFAAASGTNTISIAQYPTSMVSSVPSTATVGKTLVIEAGLVYSGSTSQIAVQPTGTVSVYDSGTLIGSTSTFTFGSSYPNRATATVSTSALGVGSHPLSVTYSGDANFVGISQAANTVVVSKTAPTVTLTSGATTYAKGASVTLTATVLLAGSAPAPAGPVVFYDGVTAIGSVTPVYNAGAGGYVATLTTTSLTTGSHNLTAVLTADANYAQVSSNVLVITITGTTTGNIWVANGNGTLSALSSSGTPAFGLATGAGGKAVAIDATGNVWSLNAGSVAEVSNAGAVLKSAITAGGVSAPTALAIDGQGYVWVTNGNNTLSVLDGTGAAVSSTAYTSVLNTPSSVSVDGSGNLWITNAGNDTVTEVIGVAAPVTTPVVNAVSGGSLGAKP